MIHLCVVWRKNKWVVTSSDTVTWHEAFDLVRREREEQKKAENYWKDSEILKYFKERQEEVVK